MKRRTFLKLLTGASCAALPLAGASACSRGASGTRATGSSSHLVDPNHLTVYLWQKLLARELVPFIREQLPGEDIEFIVGNNNVDLYCYLDEHGGLPDIITTRRFSARDARSLRPRLLDFGAYDIVSSYSPYALQYYKDSEGNVQWLPVAGIPETTIANKTLLDAHGLALPTTYAEYARLCAELDARGVKPYVAELSRDWAAHTILQAAALDQFDSLEGIAWRAAAESAEGDVDFDDGLWRRAFHEVATFLSDSRLTAADADLDLDDVEDAFAAGKAAMFRGTPEVVDSLRSRMDAELVRLPYFSQTSDETWVYTYASLNVAFARRLEEDADKLDLALRVLECIASEEGQRIIAGGSGMASYMPGVPTSLADTAGIESEVANSEFYIRYAANASFPASLAAVCGLVRGQMDEAQALDAFKEQMNAAAPDSATVQIPRTYALAVNDRGGRDAASCILTTVCAARGAQLALAPHYRFASSVYEGTCTEYQLKLMVAQDSEAPLVLARLKGSGVRALVERCLAQGVRGVDVQTVYELPVASGMRLTVRPREGGFDLVGIEVAGAALDDSAEFDVLLTSGMSDELAALSGDVATREVEDSATLSEAWVAAVAGGAEPAEPEDYMAVES